MSPIVTPKRLLVRKSDGWQDVAIVGPPGPPGGEYELGYAESTADVVVNATSAAAATTVLTLPAINFDGNTTVLVEFWSRAVPAPPAPNFLAIGFWLDGVQIGANAPLAQSGSGTSVVPYKAEHRTKPSVGSHTFSIRSWLQSGSLTIPGGTIGCQMFARVKKVLTNMGVDNVEPVTLVTAFTNGWVNYAPGSYPSAGYYRDRGRVYLTGLIKSGTLNQPAFTLPVGYRPPIYLHIPAGGDDSNNNKNICRVDAAGGVAPGGTNTWFSLDGISFRHA